jgi:hypothetical protein
MKRLIAKLTDSRARASGLITCVVFAFALVSARYANGAVVQAAGEPMSAVTTPSAISSDAANRADQVTPPPNAASSSASPRVPAPVPFGVGEVMQFKLSASAGWVLRGSGDAALRVEAVDTVRGAPAYRLAMSLKGSAVGGLWKADNVQRSWLDVEHLFSHRFHQKINETKHKRDREYDFFPKELRYADLRVPGDTGRLATAIPLDDISLIYHVRTLPLTPTSPDISASRYFREDRNPIIVRVLRTERVKVPAGEFDALVVRPIIPKAGGLFEEGGNAEVWVSNDARRLILKIKAKMGIVSATMELQSYTPGTPLSAMPGR